jgi:hypothetical protein
MFLKNVIVEKSHFGTRFIEHPKESLSKLDQ